MQQVEEQQNPDTISLKQMIADEHYDLMRETDLLFKERMCLSEREQRYAREK